MAHTLFTSRKSMAKTHGWDYPVSRNVPLMDEKKSEPKTTKERNEEDKANHQFSDSIGGDKSNYRD